MAIQFRIAVKSRTNIYFRRLLAESQVSRVRKKQGPSHQTLVQGFWILRNQMEYQSSLKRVLASSSPNMIRAFPNSPLVGILGSCTHDFSRRGRTRSFGVGDNSHLQHLLFYFIFKHIGSLVRLQQIGYWLPIWSHLELRDHLFSESASYLQLYNAYQIDFSTP